jgi:hypothetical protein
MIKEIFKQPPAERARHYLQLAEEAEQRAGETKGAAKERYEKLALEWRRIAATVKPGSTEKP